MRSNRYVNVFTKKVVTLIKHYSVIVDKEEIDMVRYQKDEPTLVEFSGNIEEQEFFDKPAKQFYSSHASIAHYNRMNNTFLK